MTNAEKFVQSVAELRVWSLDNPLNRFDSVFDDHEVLMSLIEDARAIVQEKFSTDENTSDT